MAEARTPAAATASSAGVPPARVSAALTMSAGTSAPGPTTAIIRTPVGGEPEGAAAREVTEGVGGGHADAAPVEGGQKDVVAERAGALGQRPRIGLDANGTRPSSTSAWTAARPKAASGLASNSGPSQRQSAPASSMPSSASSSAQIGAPPMPSGPEEDGVLALEVGAAGAHRLVVHHDAVAPVDVAPAVADQPQAEIDVLVAVGVGGVEAAMLGEQRAVDGAAGGGDHLKLARPRHGRVVARHPLVQVERLRALGEAPCRRAGRARPGRAAARRPCRRRARRPTR